jgi:histone H3/H4
MIVNKTRVKEIAGGLNLTQEFYESLEEEVEAIVRKSCKRAVDNNRRTLMARDL